MGTRVQIPEIKRGTIVEWFDCHLRIVKIRKDYAVCEIVVSGLMVNMPLKILASAVVIKQ